MSTNRNSAVLVACPRRTPVPVLGCLMAALAILAILATPALAGEPGFYSAGKFHPIVVSETEFAVEFNTATDRQAFDRQMRTSQVGVLEDVPWGSSSGRIAILRMPEGTASRMRVREMAGVRSVNRVYHMCAGGPAILSSGDIVVCLNGNLSDAERAAFFEQYRVDVVGEVPGLPCTYVVTPNGEAMDAELDTANALYCDDRTKYAHPDMRLPIDRRQVDIVFGPDPFFNQQWHMFDSTVGIDMFGAWARTVGGNVVIGQLDDACDVEHEDLIFNYGGISQDISINAQNATAANPQQEGDRHGTATMGIMVGSSNNNVGVVGIALGASFTASRGLSDFVTTSQIASAYNFARNANVDVHNNSWGFEAGTPNPDVIANAVETAFREGRDGLGIVVCFAAGSGAGLNEDDPTGVEVSAGEELATLRSVIGVGASNGQGEVASYSNFGQDIDVLAPSNDFPINETFLPWIVTTDNTDGAFVDSGYNDGGFADGRTDLADPNYTKWFGGTSAAAPQVAGLAALILSLEPAYTAVDVRNIIEHTCDKIPNEDVYNGTTNRSLRYGYGKINAGTAVEATFDGFFWPERVANVKVVGNTIFWNKDDDIRVLGLEEFGVPTTSVLVVESAEPIAARPLDTQSYTVGQEVADGVRVVANLDTEQYTFEEPVDTRYFGIYSVTRTRRRGLTYGFGVSVTSDGTVIDSGTLEIDGNGDGDGDGGDGDLPPGSIKPSVTIQVSPLSGTSPLQVAFVGNAQSDIEIPNDGFLWDFGDGVTSKERVTTHLYTVASGTRRFFARLTATDVEGNVGARSVAIDVTAPADGGSSGDGGAGASVSIRISDPSSMASDISAGFAPLPVILTAELSGVKSSLDDLTIFWDLGDGNTANSLSVSHSYQVAGTFPVTVRISTSDIVDPLQATRFLEVLADPTTPTPTPTPTPGPDDGDGAGPPCGVGGVMAFWAMGAFMLLRRTLR